MTRWHWFLPKTPDLLVMLRTQAALTTAGMEALVAWAEGDAAAADRLRRLEHEADDKKGELREQLTEAFSTPLEPEDLFELSRGVDEVLNAAKNLVGEAEAMETPPDVAIAEMATELAAGARRIEEAFAAFAGEDRTAATALADRAIREQRHAQHTYRRAMSALIANPNPREVAARRELYRRLARTGDDLVRVAERVWYAVLKES
jgi:uncharacterized protein Yka (UPF0111/DUF47 family)